MDGIFVTHGECEKYRDELKEKIDNIDTRVVIVETKFGIIITLLLLILVPVLTMAVTMIVDKVV